MATINYLFLASRKKDSPEYLSISYEIIYDVVNSPHWNYYGFKRSLPGIKSKNGSPGILESITFDKENRERLLIESLFLSKEINPELLKLTQERVLRHHREILFGTSELEVLLNQICRSNYSVDGHCEASSVTVQVCTETIDEITSDLRFNKQLKEEETHEGRLYSGGKYLSWLGKLTDIGRIELPKIEVSKIESHALAMALRKTPNEVFEKLLESHQEFAKNNLDLFLEFRPSPEDMRSSRKFLEILMNNNFVSNFLERSEFLSIIKNIEEESKQILAHGMDIEEIEDAYQNLKCIQKITRSSLPIERIIFSRLKTDGNPIIQADCINKITSSIGHYTEKQDSIEYAIKLISASQLTKQALGNHKVLLLFLQYAFGRTSQYIDDMNIAEEMEGSSEFIKLSRQIDRHKVGDQLRLISRIPKLIEKGEYNKSMFLLNLCFPYLIFSESSLDMAELYIECLLEIDGERTAKIIESFDVLMQRLKTLSLMVDFSLKSGAHESASLFLDKMNRLEPSSELTIMAAQKTKRAKLIESIGDKEITQESLQTLTGIEFESLLKKKFIELGFSAIETPVTGDYGADLILEDKNGTRYIVQCKRFSSKVNLKAVQEVVGAVSHYAGDYGIVMTNNQFLPSAIKLAESNNVELWNGDKLLSFFAGELEFSVISEAEL